MNTIRRSLLTTIVLVLACSGLVAVSGTRAPAPVPAPATLDEINRRAEDRARLIHEITRRAEDEARAAETAIGQATLIDCWYEEQWDYEESYADGEEMVTVYAAYQRKCWDNGGGVQCGEWHFIGWREVRTGGSGGLGD